VRCKDGHYFFCPAKRKNVLCPRCGEPMVNTQRVPRPRKYENRHVVPTSKRVVQ
jgi:hypothetical protein